MRWRRVRAGPERRPETALRWVSRRVLFTVLAIPGCSDPAPAPKPQVTPPTAAATAPLVPAPVERITGFRDLPWNADQGLLLSTLGALGDMRCSPSDPTTGYGTTSCFLDEIGVGDVPALRFYAFLRDERFVGWTFMYKTGWRRKMLPALIAKYGEPTSQRGDTAVWLGPTALVRLNGGSDYDFVWAVTRDEVARNKADIQAMGGKTAKGL